MARRPYSMAAGKGVHILVLRTVDLGARFDLGQGAPQDPPASGRTGPDPGLPAHRRRGRGGTLQGHRHRHLRGPDREPFRHHRREPHRHRQHAMAGRRFPRPGARAPGNPRRTHDPRCRPAICHRLAQGHAARRAPSPSRALLAPSGLQRPRRSEPAGHPQATGRGRLRTAVPDLGRDTGVICRASRSLRGVAVA